MNTRTLFHAATLLVVLAAALPAAMPSRAEPAAIGTAEELQRLVLHDPAAPTAGDPRGDVTIVAFLDYNCPYCRRSTPRLDAFVKADGHVRVVYKDWPILSSDSVMEAKVAIAAGYQGEYQAAHDALMAIKARPAGKEAVKAAMLAAGIDVARLNNDLAARDGEIEALLTRNNAEAEALGFKGTPVFLIGPFALAQGLDEDGFRQAVADARAKRAATGAR